MSVKGFKKHYISNAMDGTDDDMLWNGSEEDEDVRSQCKEDEGTDCEDGRQVTRINKSRQNLTCFVYSVYEINSKIFLIFLLEVTLDLDNKFSLGRHFFFFWGWGGEVILR